MRKSIKCGIAVAVVVAAGFAAYQGYGVYNTQDNSLLMQNVEALAANPKETVTNKAKEYVYATCHEVTGFKAGVDAKLNADLLSMLANAIGKKGKGKTFSATVYKYMTYRTFDGYQVNCVNVPGADCVCSDVNNGEWLEKPKPEPKWWGKEQDKCN